MNELERIGVLIQDDTNVDYIKLTICKEILDSDGDGIPDHIELGGQSGGIDTDGDGTLIIWIWIVMAMVSLIL